PELASVPAAEPPAVVMEPMPPVEEAALPAAEAPEAARWLPGWMRLDDGSARGGVDAAPVETSASAVLLASTAAPPPAPPAPRVVGLRVEQALPGTATPARSVFGLQRRFGCLWLTLSPARGAAIPRPPKARVATTPCSPSSRGRTLTFQPYRSHSRLTMDRPMPAPCEWPAWVPR